jgi:hypothetical protein
MKTITEKIAIKINSLDEMKLVLKVLKNKGEKRKNGECISKMIDSFDNSKNYAIGKLFRIGGAHTWGFGNTKFYMERNIKILTVNEFLFKYSNSTFKYLI